MLVDGLARRVGQVAALRVVEAWTADNKLEPVVEGTVVDLVKLRDFWALKAGRDPFWLPLPRLRRNGTWSPAGPLAKAEAERLDSWLERSARLLPVGDEP